MRYDLLADALVVVHFLYLVYVVLGGFLAWWWPRAFFVHLLAGIWGVLIVFELVNCPLTWAEGWAREKSGQEQVTGFIDHYVTGVVYPAQYLHHVQAAAALVVLGSWLGALVRWRRRRGVVATDPTQDTRTGDTGPAGGAATV